VIRSFNGKTPQIDAAAFISEAAYVVGDVVIGAGCSVWPGAVVRGDTGRVVIGANTAIPLSPARAISSSAITSISATGR